MAKNTDGTTTDETPTDAAATTTPDAGNPPAPPTPPLPPPAFDPQYAAHALVQAEATAAQRQADETQPGGRYKNADGTLTDANGRPLEQQS